MSVAKSRGTKDPGEEIPAGGREGEGTLGTRCRESAVSAPPRGPLIAGSLLSSAILHHVRNVSGKA